MYMPLYTASRNRKSFHNESAHLEHSNYFTILDAAYAKKLLAGIARLPAINKHMAASFSRMVKVCLAQQRQGQLTKDMLDVLIDTIEILKPHERLIVLLSNLETYRELQMLNDLLIKGHDASMGNAELKKASEERDAQAKEEALEIIDDVLFTDYHEVIRKEERGNIY